jgi:LysM repeat protein
VVGSTIDGPASPAPATGVIAFEVAVSADDTKTVQLRLDPSVLIGLPGSIQLRVVIDTAVPAGPWSDSGTSAAEPLAPPFDLRLIAVDGASGQSRVLPEGVAGSTIEVRLPMPNADLAPGEEVAWLMEVVGPAGGSIGYVRPPSVFDPLTQQQVLTVRADQLRGTRFLPVIWRTAYLRNYDPAVHIWSSPYADAVDFGVAAPQWTRMQVLSPALNQRLMVLNGFTGQPGWVAVDGVGPVPADDGLPVVPVSIPQTAAPEVVPEALMADGAVDTLSPQATPENPPAAPSAAVDTSGSYLVQPGDSLKAIAAQVDSTVAALIAANPGINADSLTIGQQLHVPVRAP